MLLKSLTLTNFRNYSKTSFDFNGANTLVLGPNASGKSNLLEAVHSLSGAGFVRVCLEEEVINQTNNFCRIKGVIANQSRFQSQASKASLNSPNNYQEKILEIFLQNKPILKKVFWINGVQKAKKDFLGNFFSTLFLPDDLQLISGAPNLRRGFLNDFLSRLNNNYYRHLLSFQRILRQRNKLLWQIREKGKADANLHFWDEKLLEQGNFLQEKRTNLIKFLNEKIIEMAEIFGLSFKLILVYQISNFNKEVLEKIRDKEIRFAQSLIGPQRDDLGFFDDNRDLALFGSRAEQRTAVFLLKMAENKTLEAKAGTKPILLLDDIFSELDENKRQIVLRLSNNQQTVITTSDKRLADVLKKNFQIVKLE